ncbi:MAG: cytidylate kinase family protein [Candidatus Micrarchaeia archaeon]
MKAKPIICISGFSASGKTTVGKKVAKLLGLKHIHYSFKHIAKKKGVSLMHIQKIAEKDKKLDLDFDARVVESAKEGGCVVTTWLSPWMVKNADLRVWLEATEETRARRLAGREKTSFKSALRHIRERDASNIRRYIRYYGIDIRDHSNFDLIINSERFSPDTIARIIKASMEV